MTNQEWAKTNQAAGRKYQIHHLYLYESILWFNWDDIIKVSPNAIRPGDWPEPDGWFWGWNREGKYKNNLKSSIPKIPRII